MRLPGINPLAAIDSVHLDFDVEWPTSAAISLASIVAYGDVFRFLLKLKMSKWMVDEVHTRGIDRNLRENPLLAPMVHRFHLLRMRISHVVNGLSTFVMTRVLHSLGIEFQDKLADAQDLDQVRKLHAWYIGQLKDRCMLRAVGYPYHFRLDSLVGAH